MKYILTAILLLCCSANLVAQSLKVEKSESAQQALTEIARVRPSQEAMGYRVGIFFDNSPNARTMASKARTLFLENFPSQSVYMVYESPYYKVSAGDCLTEEEAIMLFERIRVVFPNAFVMREKMKVRDFIEN